MGDSAVAKGDGDSSGSGSGSGLVVVVVVCGGARGVLLGCDKGDRDSDGDKHATALRMSDAMHSSVLGALDAEHERGQLMACFRRQQRVRTVPRITSMTWTATWTPPCVALPDQYAAVPGCPGVWAHVHCGGVSVLGALSMSDVLAGLATAHATRQHYHGGTKAWHYTALHVMAVSASLALSPPLTGANFAVHQHVHAHDHVDQIRLLSSSGGSSGARISLFRDGRVVVQAANFDEWFTALQALSKAMSSNRKLGWRATFKSM